MTSLFNSITSSSETTFSSIPNGVTSVVGENNTVISTTANVQANIATLNPTLYLNTTTDQTLTGSTGLTFNIVQSITNLDTIGMGDTLVVGEPTDLGIVLGQITALGPFILYIKNFLQPLTDIWRLWSSANTNLTPAGTGISLTSVAVPCRKLLSGSFVISSTATSVTFTPNFTSKPVVIISIRSTAGTEVFDTKWVTDVGVGGFTANTLTTSPTLVMNWFAFGD